MTRTPRRTRSPYGPQTPEDRPKNRAVENENLQVPAQEGVPPLPATTPVPESEAQMTQAQRDEARRAQAVRPDVHVPPHRAG